MFVLVFPKRLFLIIALFLIVSFGFECLKSIENKYMFQNVNEKLKRKTFPLEINYTPHALWANPLKQMCVTGPVSVVVYLAWCPQGPAHSGKGWGEGWWHWSLLPEAQTLLERGTNIISDSFRFRQTMWMSDTSCGHSWICVDFSCDFLLLVHFKKWNK